MLLVFSVLSILCLAVVIWIHVRFPRLQNIYGFCLVCLSVTLAASFILSVIQIITDFVSTDVAIVFTIIRHYIWLSVFAWGTVIIFHVYRSFAINVVANKICVLTIKDQSYRYAIFAWGLPIPFVVTGMICHYRLEDFVYTRHWLTSEHILPLFIFIIPALCLSFLGISLFFGTLSKMEKMRKGTDELWNHHTTDILFIAVRLQLTLGVPWISFLFLMVSNHPLKLPIVSTINSLQGILIMVAFVTTKKIKNLLKQRNRTHPTTV
ncbi:G-protein coupled receptor Mth2 [Holothuria leucospilota]|uniref:G-protein coupled receptor Mth2 n=1 Tax=Holothuria leucospilota TaxID=206669 RepID=A0A9Q1H3G2_HOLLE|nr:G-protein coupled receptor Mth2 [Holothuria leucospilota]